MNDIHALTDEYVVGSLDPDETSEFETHLESCSDCREEVAEMRILTGQLSASVAAAPPPSLRTSILAAIAQTPQDGDAGEQQDRASLRQETPAAPIRSVPQQLEIGRQPTHRGARVEDVASRGTAPEAAAPPTAPLEGDAASGSNVVQLRPRAPRAVSLLAAAAVLAAIGFGGWALESRDSARDATAQTEQITRLLGAGDVRTASGSFADGGAGTVVLSKDQKSAILVAADLPKLGDGKVYEAWTIKKAIVPAGTFHAEGSNAVIDLPSAALDASAVAVTVEPSGGSKHPTSDPIFTVKLPRA